ncbi:DUF721 domain-containing protein [filamentous cyanobacterium CCP5]|nr:DUF721 domain-containing protein [filamentous cyanobacterium CCP5]
MEALGRLIQTLEQQPRWRTQGQLRRILAGWSAAVGENVARQSEPVRLSRGILYVAVTNPTWAQTLTMERLRILNKINLQISPPRKEIRFSTGDWWQRPRRSLPAEGARLQGHPCYWPGGSAPADISTTPEAAFAGWAERHRQLAEHQPRCPDCACPCPTGELERWHRCSICAAKAME